MNEPKPELGPRIAGEIVTLIRQRRYLPGERLPSERELAERFSVGRPAVREAVTALETMRYVERRPGSGMFLRREPESLETLVLFAEIGLPIEPKVNADCVEVRRIIEVQAVALACERRDAADLAALEAVMARFGENEAFAAAAPAYDHDFHMALIRATHNGILVRLVAPFYMIARTRREVFFTDAGRRRESHEQHRAMLDAITKRDAYQARGLMAAHIGRVEKYFA